MKNNTNVTCIKNNTNVTCMKNNTNLTGKIKNLVVFTHTISAQSLQ